MASWLEQRATAKAKRLGNKMSRVHTKIDGKAFTMYPVSKNIKGHIKYELNKRRYSQPETSSTEQGPTPTEDTTERPV